MTRGDLACIVKGSYKGETVRVNNFFENYYYVTLIDAVVPFEIRVHRDSIVPVRS
mgnify:CR=1 FL=1